MNRIYKHKKTGKLYQVGGFPGVKVINTTKSWLNVVENTGCRTFVIAMRILTEDEYKVFTNCFFEAHTDEVDTKLRINKVVDSLESHLTLLGGAFIEDFLPEKIEEAISNIKDAGIKKSTASDIKKLISAPLKEFYVVCNEFAQREFKNPTKKSKFKPIKTPSIPKITDDFAMFIYVLLLPLAKLGYAEKWDLQRKINEFTRASKKNTIQDDMFFKKTFTLAPVKIDAYKIAQLLADSDKSAFLAGRNTYDGVHWFNKEMMENSLKLAEKILCVGLSKSSAAKVCAIFKKLAKAAEKSGYKCEEFIKPFEPKKTKTVKKTTAKKTSSAKARPKK